MKIETWLKQAQQKLKVAGIGTARLDALVLLEDELNKNRAQLLARPEVELTKEQIKELSQKLTRRTKHEPLAYIRGFTEFYGRKFLIDKNVLEPRPESETMIDLALKLADLPAKPLVADVGTGSGALGITLKLELPQSRIDLLEIDNQAIKVAQQNVIKFTTSISIIQSDLLSNSSGNYDLLLCNLPYVPDSYRINEAAKTEPRIAIFGGSDGLDIYRKLFTQISNQVKKPLYILTESLPPQHVKLNQIAKLAGYKLETIEDFIQVFKNAS